MRILSAESPADTDPGSVSESRPQNKSQGGESQGGKSREGDSGAGEELQEQSDPGHFEQTRAAYIPFGYFADFLRLLKRNEDLVEIITYDDLRWSPEPETKQGYPEERARWLAAMADGDLSGDKIYVVLQHDVDTVPERTETILRLEEELGVRSAVMIFTQRVNRRRLRETGELELTEYPLDLDYLEHLQEKGFVIGYHCNAFERAVFDAGRAEAIVRQDIAELSSRFDLRYMSAHGGVAAPDGRNNRDLSLPVDVAERIRWVHNGNSPWFVSDYSDGGLNSPKRDPARRDLRDFVRTWRRGGRYRVLTHPQYYNDPCGVSPRMKGTPWYEEVLRIYERPAPASAWEDAVLVESGMKAGRPRSPRWRAGMLEARALVRGWRHHRRR